MNDNSYLKIFTLIGFLAFAAVSCWATAESLHMLLPDLPAILCWVVTVGFFFIASWGTKMIVDSFNQNIYMEKRGLSLVGGIIIVIVFWLFCSMPTNTHTFFYRNLINDRVTHDISTTQLYLGQIKDGSVTADKIKDKQKELLNKIEIKLGELKAEIENDANPGNGPKAQAIFKDFAELLGVAKVEPLTYTGTSVQDRKKLYDAYRQKVLILSESKLKNIEEQMTPKSNTYKKDAAKAYKNLELTKKYIDEGKLSLTDAQGVKTVCEKLNQGYSTIKTHQQFADFKNEADKNAYTSANPETKVKRLLSVYDVWVDFLTGKFGGLSFLFWILVSVLVDIAAFIFFDIAFKKQA